MTPSASRRAAVYALSALLVAAGLAKLLETAPPTLEARNSDFRAYYWAGKRVGEGRAAELYAERDVDSRGRSFRVKDFKNIPIVAVAFAPYARLAYPSAWRAWWLTSLVGSVIGFVAACVWLRRWNREWILASSALFLAAAWCYPMTRSFAFGQTSQLIAAALFLAYVALESRREWLGGALLGLCAVVKIPMLLFAVPLFGARRWRAAAAFSAIVVTAALLSLALFGIEVHREWVRVVIAENAGSVFTAANNQSFIAQAMRLASASSQDLVRYTPSPLPRGIAIAQFGLVAVVTLLWSLARRRVPQPTAVRLDFCVCIALMPTVFPVFWIHYALFTLVALLVLSRIAIERLPGRRLVLALPLACVYALIAPFPTQGRGARYYADHGTDLWIDLWIGRFYAGSLVLLIACFVFALHLGRRAPAAPGDDAPRT